jgi:hypothetical protein
MLILDNASRHRRIGVVNFDRTTVQRISVCEFYSEEKVSEADL